MRSFGLALIVVGALTTIGAMFLPYYTLPAVGTFNYWQEFNGLDIALVIACGASACLAVVARFGSHPGFGGLAGILAAVVFGLAFAPVPIAIDDTSGTRMGTWIVAATGAVGLAGAVVSAFARRD